MDEEDIADAEEARKVQTADAYSAIGSTADEVSQKATVMDLFKTSGETMGVKLLRKMGWRDGQGIGPKVRRKARLGEDAGLGSGELQETHLFAPDNSEMIAFGRKSDRKGLGFESEGRLGETSTPEQQSKSRLAAVNGDEEDAGIGTLPAKSLMRKKKTATRGSFGVGILNDNGSDDDDPYSMGPQISYNRVIGGGKKKNPLSSSRTAANPLLNSKPIFISKKAAATKTASTFRRCHDGRLPLDGFVLSSNPDPLSSILSSDNKYPPPVIPPDWKSAKRTTSNPLSVPSTYLSTAEVAKASTLSPKSRAALLGESQLPGKSIFDFLSTTARSRIATATKNPNLPPALNEASSSNTTSAPSTRTLSSLIPQLDPQTALTALGRGTAGWMPYAEDPSKRTRYRSFLEIRAGLRDPQSSLPDRAPGHSTDEWATEMREFAHAAQIFKPMTGMMASRFTSASSAPKLASDRPDAQSAPRGEKGEERVEEENLVSRPAEKKKDPAEEAARLGMYGPLTRSTQAWHPTRLLCKRFNVRPPAHVMVDPGAAALSTEKLELVGKREMEEMMREGNVGRMGMRDAGAGMTPGETGIDEGGAGGALPKREEVIVDPERNDALEKERPSDAMFKAVFGSDSEDDG